MSKFSKTNNGLFLPAEIEWAEAKGDPNVTPVVRKRHVGNGVIIEAPYFQMLVRGETEKGRLPKDLAAHALWHYYLIAYTQWERSKKALVYEGDKNPTFEPRVIIKTLATLHGVPVEDMIRYWDVVEQQRRALGYSINASLPERYRFTMN